MNNKHVEKILTELKIFKIKKFKDIAEENEGNIDYLLDLINNYSLNFKKYENINLFLEELNKMNIDFISKTITENQLKKILDYYKQYLEEFEDINELKYLYNEKINFSISIFLLIESLKYTIYHSSFKDNFLELYRIYEKNYLKNDFFKKNIEILEKNYQVEKKGFFSFINSHSINLNILTELSLLENVSKCSLLNNIIYRLKDNLKLENNILFIKNTILYELNLNELDINELNLYNTLFITHNYYNPIYKDINENQKFIKSFEFSKFKIKIHYSLINELYFLNYDKNIEIIGSRIGLLKFEDSFIDSFKCFYSDINTLKLIRTNFDIEKKFFSYSQFNEQSSDRSSKKSFINCLKEDFATKEILSSMQKKAIDFEIKEPDKKSFWIFFLIYKYILLYGKSYIAPFILLIIINYYFYQKFGINFISPYPKLFLEQLNNKDSYVILYWFHKFISGYLIYFTINPIKKSFEKII